MDISPVREGTAVAVTVALLYVACAVVAAVAPGGLAGMLDIVVHGLDIAPLTAALPPVTLSDVLLGLVLVSAYGFAAGCLYGAIRNALARLPRPLARRSGAGTGPAY